MTKIVDLLATCCLAVSVRAMKSMLTLFLVLLSSVGLAAERPNVVWLVSEDNSKHYLKLFDEMGAPTPNIAKLAEHGLLFEHAFSNSPVCSVARTTLQTGCYGPRIGTQYHRRSELAAMPEGLKMFPAYLADAGYYTTNNSKKDYNAVETEGNWHESSNKASWRNRSDKAQPFFHMQSFGTSHEGRLHFSAEQMAKEETTTDPASVVLAPYHPDTPTFRYTYARYHDKIVEVDREIGAVVDRLAEDGLLEDTFIFYFGDHGGVLPGGKGYVREAGLHVPLVVRVPENFKHLADAEIGSKIGGFVSFVDFGPTTLNLCGVEIPSQVDGKPFLGAGVKMDDVNSRDEAFGYADRFDEKYEFIRTLRKGKYKYHRNYEGYYPDGLQNNYRYLNLAFEEWRKLFQEGKLNDVQARFYQSKPAEELYDVESDPHQTKNLAGAAAFTATLEDLRGRLGNRVRSMPDLSFHPEFWLVNNAMENPVAYGQKNKAEIEDLADIADLAIQGPTEEVIQYLVMRLKAKSSSAFWALKTCTQLGSDDPRLVEGAKAHLEF